MNKFIMIFGTHGSGKTTLVKNILISDNESDIEDGLLFDDSYDYYERNCKYGKYTISKAGNYVAVGSYQNKCGGADGIRNSEIYFKVIDFLTRTYNNNVLVEGVIQHSYDSLVDLFNDIRSMGFEVHLVLLEVDLDKSIERIISRNGKMPNVDNVRCKIDAMNS